MKTATNFSYYVSEHWHLVVKRWTESGLVTFSNAGIERNSFRKFGPKTGRVHGVAYSQIRKYAAEHERFTAEQMVEDLKITHLQAKSRLGNLVTKGEIASSNWGLSRGKQLKPIFHATPKLKPA